jgi:DNA-binding transcriptional LysR family regulator
MNTFFLWRMVMEYTLQQLRYLVAVADHGSVSAAARSLYVSQPGVSAAISYLENLFGIQCFVRHHAKGVTLTPAGKSFVASAKNVLAQAQELHHRADELNHTIRGRLTLGCYSILGAFFLPRILEMLRTAYPDLSVQIHDGDSESLLRWLRDGTIEVGLMYDINCDPIVFSKHHLTSLRPYALLPGFHPLADQNSVSPSEIVDEPLILLNYKHHCEYLLSVFDGIDKPVNIRHRVNDFQLACELVAAGKGYAILNLRPASDQAYDGSPVKCVPIRCETPPASIVLASVQTSRPSARTAALINACSNVMQKFDPVLCRWERPDLAPPN